MTDTIRIYDLRSKRLPSRPKIKMATATEPALFRPGAIEGVVLHQTAVRFATPKGGGERELAARALNVACHVMAFDGFFTAATPIAWVVNHGNGFNRRALGIEIDGHYPGLVSHPLVDGTEWTPSREESARHALAWLVQEARDAGHPCDRLWAHRQSSSNRRGDPGEQIWRSLVPWAEQTLGMRCELDAALPSSNSIDGPGRPIPREWDARGTVAY